MGGVNLLFFFHHFGLLLFLIVNAGPGALPFAIECDLTCLALPYWHRRACRVIFSSYLLFSSPDESQKEGNQNEKKSFKEEARHFLKLTLIKARLLLWCTTVLKRFWRTGYLFMRLYDGLSLHLFFQSYPYTQNHRPFWAFSCAMTFREKSCLRILTKVDIKFPISVCIKLAHTSSSALKRNKVTFFNTTNTM